MAFDKSQFFQVFFEEAGEHLETIEELLLALDAGSSDQEDLNAIFRAVHSIKGGAGTFGFKEMTEVSHIFESVLDRVRKGTLETNSEMVDLFLETRDILDSFLNSYQEGSTIDPEAGADVCERLKRYTSEEGEETSKTLKAGEKKDQDTKPVQEENAEEEDPGFGFFDEVSTEKDEIPTEEAKKKEEDELGFGFFEEVGPEVHSEVQSEDISEDKPKERRNSKGRRTTDYIDESESPIRGGRRDSDRMVNPVSRAEKASSLRIEVKKVDKLFNQVGEIVITQAMLEQMASKLDPAVYENIHNGLAQLERNTRNLQESVMEIRMVPCRSVFSRFPRLIRDMRKSFNKEVELIMVGEETEVDKGFVEKLVDPLTHLVRNSFDHGIESPEERQASGKAPKGTITLRASHQGGNVVIEVSDDGAGLNRERILAKAHDRGMEISESITDQEVWQLIFTPGLSTTEMVSDLSGRGVGMDVVKRNVQAMGGVIRIESVPGQGSRFIIKLPLTLAIIEAMIVRVGKETYILPLISIVESVRPKPSDLNNVLDKAELVNVRGRYIPVIRLYELFEVEPETTDPCKAVLVIVESEGGYTAVLVDELLGQQQVVIKSLEDNFKKVSGIGGATILGDGKVAFILDVIGLSQLTNKKEGVLVG